ncbi:MAG: site-2 protease family protein [Nitrolancea sp.]
MEASWKLGRIRGIEIGVHYTWIFIFALLSYSLAVDYFPSLYDNWTTGQYWTISVIASLLLFASVVAHELGHSLVAIARGIPVKNITLFIFGGVASLTQDTQDAKTEFQVAIAGPAVSFVIAAVSLGLSYLMRNVNSQLEGIFFYLAMANGLLVAFNLIPGFPLDGGRVFRSIVWGITHSMDRATNIAGTLGVIIGYLFIVLGVFVMFAGVLISGIWFVAIGWFLQNAAQQSMQQLRMEETFQDVTIAMLMRSNPVTVEPETTLEDLVEHHILGQNTRGVPVVRDGVLQGIITLSDIKSVPRTDWRTFRVLDRMTPRERLVTVTPDSPLSEALQEMSERDIHQIPVVRGELLVGLLTRNDVIRFIQLRNEIPRSRK